MIARLMTILLLLAQPVPAVLAGTLAPATDTTMLCCGGTCCCSAGACACSSQDQAPAPADTPLLTRSLEMAPTLPASVVVIPRHACTGYALTSGVRHVVVPSHNRRQALLGCWHN